MVPHLPGVGGKYRFPMLVAFGWACGRLGGGMGYPGQLEPISDICGVFLVVHLNYRYCLIQSKWYPSFSLSFLRRKEAPHH